MALQNSWNSDYNNSDGQLLIGSTGNNPVSATLTPGFGISITNGPGSILIASNGQEIWEVITTSTHQMEAGKGYIVNSASLVTLTLPEEVPVGSVMRVTSIGTGGWKIAQNDGQQIRFGNTETTLGTSGNLQFTQNGDTVGLVCTVEDTNFNVIASIGNIEIDAA